MKVTFAQLQAIWARAGGYLLYKVHDGKVESVIFGQAAGVPVATLIDKPSEADFIAAFPGFTVEVTDIKDLF